MPIRFFHLAALLVSGAAHLALAYATPRAHFGQLLALFAVAFGAYAFLLRTKLPLRQGLVAAALLRLLWLPALPALSDDYHRFRWDGLLVARGVSPYQYRPEELVTAAPPAAARRLADVQPELAVLYPRLNSPRYYSVYPPVCQAAFGLASGLCPRSERGAVLVLRLLLLLAEAGTAALLLRLLRAFGLPARRALGYLLNPLVVAELIGNLHFEALVVCGVLGALALLVRGRLAWSAGVLGLAVGAKLLPLLVLPLLARRLPGRQFAIYAAVVGLALALQFLAFLSADLLLNIGRSLNLYFRSFEFNASLYYLLRAGGYWLTGYNQIAVIGPALAAATAAAGLGLAFGEKRPTWATLPRTLLLLLAVYYLLATVVHPWYLAPLVALSVFAPYRFARVWSGLAVLSYAAYRTPAYTESPWLLALEYAGVLAVLALDLQATRASGQLTTFDQRRSTSPTPAE